MKIKKSEIKEIIRQTLNEITSGDIEELETIVKELEGASKMHQGQSEQLAAASKMHKGQSERIDKIIKSVSKTDEELSEEKNCGCGQTPCITYGKQEEDFGMSAKQLPSFSSKEAKTIIDSSIRQYATLLRKAEAKIIKDWMTKAKSGVLDYFDIVRGLQTGDASRAYAFELRFLKGILDRDKIMNRFRSYYKGKKGKKR
tara:strand:+ start:725 stop:1324 length:600 start_codon:yes stop_codon:yes gene_type:complete